MDTIFADLEHRGFAVIAEALMPAEVDALRLATETLPAPTDAEARAGVRNLFSVMPATRHLAQHPAVSWWPAAVLGGRAFAVRALYFDKTPGANWRMAWHQDVTIPTRERREVEGFGPWSEKAGIPHVQAPTAVLERMLSVRVHLDPCGLIAGPIRVLPGTHRRGRLTREEIERLRVATPEVTVQVPAGGLLLMRPLLLHASSPAAQPVHRRVIHLEYAADPLPGGLEWWERWGAEHPAPRMRLTRLGRRLVSV